MDRRSFIEKHPEHFNAITNSEHLYEKAPCGFISFLPDGAVLRVNETLISWLGLSEEEVYNLNFSALLSKGAKLYYQMIVSPLLTIRGFANEIDFSFVGKGGDFNALFNAIAYKDEQGSLLAINATLQSITDRKKYEAELLRAKQHAEEEKRKFESLSDTIPNLVWTALPNGQINFINQRIKDYFNVLDLEGLDGFLGVVEEDRENLMITWEICLKNGRKLNREVRLKSKDEVPEWFLLCAEPYFNAHGVLELWFGSCTNIHKQKLLQLANYSSLSTSLSIAHQTIDTNNEMFMKIAFDQSHMIRKPLANIIGLVSLLNDMPVTDEVKQLINLLDTSATELDTHVKDVVNKTSISG